MKLILLERVEKLGAIGDVVTVKDGFARNFLLPRQKALRATSANQAVFEAQRAQIEARNAENRAEAERRGQRLDGSTYVLIRQAGESGQLYGSVSARDVSDVAQAQGDRVERNQVVLETPIKTLGVHTVKVRLHPEVTVTVSVNIARSVDEAERQARGENVIASAFDQERLDAEAQARDLFEGGAGQAIADDRAGGFA
ncbi:MAG: 50S ribosomal protein L9 [Proteobacteria bacterium]|nr:50S ribosomal protein L9 [Pseudomonadota bacterium]MBW3616180.1 50S ribosomal protein L9 [Pseudomonadota bacterium]